MAKVIPSFGSLSASARRNPTLFFWVFAGAHLALWTLIPTLTSPNVMTDVIEGYAWGHDWPLGTLKHPPLASWILEIFAIITGRASWAHFLATQLSVTIAFWAVWQTGRRIVGEAGALVGAFLLVGIVYYNVIIPEFNPNVLQLPFWALMGWSFHRAIKDGRLVDWLLLGVWCAAGLYTKYSSILMPISIGVFMLVHPQARKKIARPGPWLAKLTAILLFLPHFLWLYDHNFRPLFYAESRLDPVPYGAIVSPALLLLGQIAACLPAILIFAIAFGKEAHPPQKRLRSFDGMFLSFVTFGPLFLALAIAAFTGASIRTMWGTPFWNFLGLWAVFVFRLSFSVRSKRRFAELFGLVFILGLVVAAGKNIFEPYYTHKAGRLYFPGRSMAEQITEAWHQRYHTPLPYVVGDVWAAGNLAYYSSDRPHALIIGDPHYNAWVTQADIEESGRLAKKYGGVMVWCRGTCPYADNMKGLTYYSAFTQAVEQPVLTLSQQTGAPVPPAVIGWAFLPPPQK